MTDKSKMQAVAFKYFRMIAEEITELETKFV
jgi:hypothetical protein